jgi:hypothetical protein
LKVYVHGRLDRWGRVRSQHLPYRPELSPQPELRTHNIVEIPYSVLSGAFGRRLSLDFGSSD